MAQHGTSVGIRAANVHPSITSGGYPSGLANPTTTSSGGEQSTVSGYVWKRKREGRWTRLLNQFNKRYLTIDFAKEYFFYSSPSIWASYPDVLSQAYPFGDLLSAYPISSPEAYRSLIGQFGIVEIDEGTMLTPSAQHGICVQTRHKEFEFYFLSSDDVNMWLQAFERALKTADRRRDGQSARISTAPPAVRIRDASGPGGLKAFASAPTAATAARGANTQSGVVQFGAFAGLPEGGGSASAA